MSNIQKEQLKEIAQIKESQISSQFEDNDIGQTLKKIQEDIAALKTENTKPREEQTMYLTELTEQKTAVDRVLQEVVEADTRIKRGFEQEKQALATQVGILNDKIRKLDDSLLNVNMSIALLVPKLKTNLERTTREFVETLNNSHFNSVSMFSQYLDSSLHSTQEHLINISTSFLQIGNNFNESLSKAEHNVNTGIKASLEKSLEEKLGHLNDSINSGLTNIVANRINSLDNSLNSKLLSIRKHVGKEEEGMFIVSLANDLYWFTDMTTVKSGGFYYPDNDKSQIVRLANITKGNNWVIGRLEVQHDDQWGTVCDDKFDNTNAKVACTMFSTSSVVYSHFYPAAHFGQGRDLPILLDDVQCSGSESSIFDCGHYGVTNHDCQHSEDLGIYCRWNK